MDLFLGFVITLVLIFIIPIFVYGLFAAFFGLKEPDKKLEFMLGVLVQKIGTALGFSALFYLGRGAFADSWLLYSLVWAAMFVITEMGQTILSSYSLKEAWAGAVSEVIYFPLAGAVLAGLMR